MPPHLDEDWLVLSTVHSAKGLEWQSVHVIAAYDGNFPAGMAAGTEEAIDEERRLLYVALTRARRELARLRAAPLLPPARGAATTPRLRQGLALPDGEVRRTCEPGETRRRIASARPDHAPRKISVSVDALFR